MRSIADTERPGSLPAASQLWWKSKIIHNLLAEEAAENRATRPLAWSQALGVGVATVALLFGVLRLTSGLLEQWAPAEAAGLLATVLWLTAGATLPLAACVAFFLTALRD